jgi:hypothetical protein
MCYLGKLCYKVAKESTISTLAIRLPHPFCGSGLSANMFKEAADACSPGDPVLPVIDETSATLNVRLREFPM